MPFIPHPFGSVPDRPQPAPWYAFTEQIRASEVRREKDLTWKTGRIAAWAHPVEERRDVRESAILRSRFKAEETMKIFAAELPTGVRDSGARRSSSWERDDEDVTVARQEADRDHPPAWGDLGSLAPPRHTIVATLNACSFYGENQRFRETNARRDA